MKRILQFLLSFLSLALGCVSCLTEVEVGGCNNAVVRFEYMADGAEDCFAEYISAVDYYIYDEQGSLVIASRLDRRIWNISKDSSCACLGQVPIRWCVGET